jgi:hypothetical protein
LTHAVVQIYSRCCRFALQGLQSAFDGLQLTLQQLNIAQMILLALQRKIGKSFSLRVGLEIVLLIQERRVLNLFQS